MIKGVEGVSGYLNNMFLEPGMSFKCQKCHASAVWGAQNSPMIPKTWAS